MRRSRPETLTQDRAEHAQTVSKSVQVAHTVDPRPFEARHFRYEQTGLESANVQLRLDLEPLGVDGELRQASRPESVVAIAEVGIPSPEQQVDEGGERAVPEPAQPRDVGAAAVTDEARALREIGPGEERFEEAGNLLDARRAVGVQHDDDLRADCGKAGDESVPFPSPGLADHPCRWAQPGRDLRGPVDRVAVDDDDLVLRTDPRQHVRQVRGFVESRDDHAHRRRTTFVRRTPPMRRRGRHDHLTLFLSPIAPCDRRPQSGAPMMSCRAPGCHPVASGSKIRRETGCGSPRGRRRHVQVVRRHLGSPSRRRLGGRTRAAAS